MFKAKPDISIRTRRFDYIANSIRLPREGN